MRLEAHKRYVTGVRVVYGASVERAVPYLLPSLGDVLFASLLLGGVLVLQGRALGVDGDAGWTVRLGQIILAQGLPRSEPLLAMVRGQPLVDWEWLAQVAYAAADRLGGLNGVVALAALLVATSGLSLLTVLRRHGLRLLPALALTLCGVALLAMDWTARAQLFSIPLTLWWAEWIWRYWHDGQRWRLVGFPLATALWANLHAGFVGGLLLLAAAVVLAWLMPAHRGRAEPRGLLLALVASLAATLLTPWGVALPLHMLAFARDPLVAASTQEFQSPDFHQWNTRVFLVLLSALLALWIWGRAPGDTAADATARPKPRPEPLAVVFVALWTALSLMYVRFMPLWPGVVLPLLADAVVVQGGSHHAWPQPTGRAQAALRSLRAVARRSEATDARVGHGLWSTVALVGVLLLVRNGGMLPGAEAPLLHARFDPRVFPVTAVRVLRAQGLPAGRGFNPYSWGGYLEYALPQDQPFIDSRSDVYGQDVLRDYATVEALAPGWQGVLAHDDIRWALLPASGALAQVLALTPGWRCGLVGGDGVAVLCVRGAASAPA